MEAVAQGATRLSDLQAQLGVATCCGRCADTAIEYLPGGLYAADAAAMPAKADDGALQVTLLSRTEVRHVA